jgi:hypothetical protein
MNTRVRVPALMWGIALIALGVLFQLDRLDIIEFGRVVNRYWPVIIIAVGAAKALSGNLWGGFWMIVVGTWLQMVRLRMWGMSFDNSWPLLLVAFGAAMIGRALFGSVKNAAQ